MDGNALPTFIKIGKTLRIKSLIGNDDVSTTSGAQQSLAAEKANEAVPIPTDSPNTVQLRGKRNDLVKPSPKTVSLQAKERNPKSPATIKNPVPSRQKKMSLKAFEAGRPAGVASKLPRRSQTAADMEAKHDKTVHGNNDQG